LTTKPEIPERRFDEAAPEAVGAGGIAALPALAEGDEPALGVVRGVERVLDFVEEEGAE
jgi:hypothetical protein